MTALAVCNNVTPVQQEPPVPILRMSLVGGSQRDENSIIHSPKAAGADKYISVGSQGGFRQS